MTGCIEALSTLPPLPSYDATDLVSFSTTEAFQPMPMFSDFDATSPAISAFNSIESLQNLSLPIPREESMYYLQDAGSLQIEFTQAPYASQYISQ